MKCNKNFNFTTKFEFFLENMGSWWWVSLIWCFYFVIENSTFDSASLCFFVINLLTVALFVLDESLNRSNSLSKGMTHSLCMHHIIKKIVWWQVSEIDIFTNKLDNSDSTTILWVFFTHFHFKLVLSSNIYSWLANIYYS